MATNTVRACVRCHRKKTKCSGYPDCLACGKARTHCEPYTRYKKSDSLAELKYFRQRASWLEDEIFRNFRIQCKDVPTGSCLKSEGGDFTERPTPSPGIISPSTQSHEQGPSTPAGNAADIGMLALNATGEMKYLGPSSGAFFAAYASALARSCLSTKNFGNILLSSQQGEASRAKAHISANSLSTLSSHDINLFLISYKMWILPLYPVLNSDDLDMLIKTYAEETGKDDSQMRQGNSEKDIQLMVFYMVMALGAVNAANTIQQIRKQSRRKDLLGFEASGPSPISLCTRALQLYDYNSHILHPSVGLIQVFALIAIYSSFGPIGSSQWQLAGFAMRMAVEIGLHCTDEVSDAPDGAKDQRNRVFWTIYAIEISLAYNLGRPPSIAEDHIAKSLMSGKPIYQPTLGTMNNTRIATGIVSIMEQHLSCTEKVRSAPVPLLSL
ncbi:uncharacterized protein TrAtP1_010647 [Trichoderma atroviride]|uniref:uncharacterized protein n=1 Tax=Hypocrea atroviridis TaxID=63577 RepID=UPI003316F982|nr:hypothetical protein TrAtP1_010647 [Trichoderma atroviride]